MLALCSLRETQREGLILKQFVDVVANGVNPNRTANLQSFIRPTDYIFKNIAS